MHILGLMRYVQIPLYCCFQVGLISLKIRQEKEEKACRKKEGGNLREEEK